MTFSPAPYKGRTAIWFNFISYKCTKFAQSTPTGRPTNTQGRPTNTQGRPTNTQCLVCWSVCLVCWSVCLVCACVSVGLLCAELVWTLDNQISRQYLRIDTIFPESQLKKGMIFPDRLVESSKLSGNCLEF